MSPRSAPVRLLTRRFTVKAPLEAGSNWRWVGPFLWITVHDDHRFEARGPAESEITFVLDGEGFGVRVFGRLFASIYARKLDRAIPNLIKELEEDP